jgi:hypothetical protein
MFSGALDLKSLVVGVGLLFVLVIWLACTALAWSMALRRRGVPFAGVALILGLALGPIAVLWASTLRRGPTELG